MAHSFWEYLPNLALVYGILALGLLSPGPNVMAVIGTAMSTDRRTAFWLGTGISSGTLLWSSLTIAGVTAFLQAYATAAFALRVAGGCYLLYLAAKSLKAALSADAPAAAVSTGARTRRQAFLRGFTVQMTNPKAALMYMSLVSLAVQPHAPTWVAAAMVIGSGMISMVGHTAYALLFSTGPVVSFYRHWRRRIEVALAGFFCFAGLRVLTSR